MRTHTRATLALVVAGVVAACSNAGSDLGFGESETTAVSVSVYLDRDGSRTLTPLDTVFANARVALLLLGSGDTLLTQNSNTLGIARFESVPLGQYRVVVVASSIGDSIQVASVDSATIRLIASDTNHTALARLGYPEVSIRAARALPAGRRVFIRGVILAGVQSFRDQTSHVSDSSGQIRLTNVVLKGGLLGNAPGDSVSVLGMTSVLTGQAILANASIAKFGQRPAPIPLPISTATAASANNGVLDAGLILVTGALVSDSVTVSPDFQVTASDGSGNLKILLDANLPFARSQFRPGRSMNVRGVLVPDGAGSWMLKPRDVSDVVFNN